MVQVYGGTTFNPKESSEEKLDDYKWKKKCYKMFWTNPRSNTLHKIVAVRLLGSSDMDEPVLAY